MVFGGQDVFYGDDEASGGGDMFDLVAQTAGQRVKLRFKLPAFWGLSAPWALNVECSSFKCAMPETRQIIF